MTVHDRMFAWCKVEQAKLHDLIDHMSSGKMRTGEADASGRMIDRTAWWIEEYKRRLAEINEILGRADPRSEIEPG